MGRVVTYKAITPKGKLKGWDRIKIVHVTEKKYEYKEFYYTTSATDSHYREHLYKTDWIRVDKQ